MCLAFLVNEKIEVCLNDTMKILLSSQIEYGAKQNVPNIDTLLYSYKSAIACDPDNNFV